MPRPRPAYEVDGSCILFRPRTVAGMLSISESTLGRLIAAGKLRAIRVGSQNRISKLELERYLASVEAVA